MNEDEEGYSACFSEAGNYWYVFRRQLKGAVLHREIQAEHFDSEADALAEIERRRDSSAQHRSAVPSEQLAPC